MALNIQPAIKKETLNVTIYTVIGSVVVILLFLLGHFLEPEYVPFDYKVIFGTLAGGMIAVLNFFLMGMTVQKVASTEDEDNAKNLMKMSYRRRTLIQIAWVVVAIVAPCFNWLSGILPLFFPTLGIKIKGIISNFIYSKKTE